MFFSHLNVKQSVFGDELKWDYVQERGHSNVSRLLVEVVRFVQRKHFVLGLVWGVRFALISSFCNLLADFFLGQVEVVDTLDTYLKTKDMRETATTSMSSKLNPLRQKAFLCRMNP